VTSSVSDALVVLRAHGAHPVEGRARLREIAPWSWEVHLADRVLAILADRRGRVVVGPDGAWFERDGVRAGVASAQLRRLLAALADHAASGGEGLPIEALFGAGWPGERAQRASQANRVRVAITRLRQAGVPVRFARGRGWSLGQGL
jgi:hypothetical protein